MTDENTPEGGGETRRDFIHIAAASMAAIGGAAVIWPFIDQMNPAADTLALGTTDIALGELEEGQEVTIMFRSMPHFVRLRSASEVEDAANVQVSSLPDRLARNRNLDDNAPATDDNRSALTAEIADGVEISDDLRRSLLVTSASCTHLGCVPTEGAGEFGAWFCPCHGSHYDTSGRIRRGPAPENLPIPPMTFISATTLRLG
ncbi:ubiquinol-cytochrome c reductase iron-sulfur subunit [Alkalicaulis satelles]|uniref:Ubiquinol-cytochrome c reductase iron-sulfur subunit n=1 Tax=Alkalicaulis satelles TaxID=2609175 RepID=A0A5M6ZGZ0_9PROT|nr:ubiquinol-cytochrome c reductase iron-sulfur subunit [Alkalicaulis satelles]KAA5802418.1 ubiquinol-cytochrome c reductase iron-sulfur subunit [Alkalicaulis satelles]